VIYTSGSTGNPKGCMLEHRGLVNYIEWTKNYNIHAEFSEVDFFSSLSFDFTVTSLFGSLLFGKTLRIYSSNEDLSLQLKQIILNENSAWVKLTPAHVSLIETETLRIARSKVFVLGGEALTVEQIKHLRKNRECTIFNEYGPTEATVGCIVKEISENNMPFIGQSLNNMEVVLLDSGLKLVPFGSVGEICISGIGLARGYINRDDLTLEKFIENPYHSGNRLYRTGDLGRWREDGNLEYLGRTDDQVKIRGYRIELSEIEQALSTISNSGQTCVLARSFNQTGEKELIVYFTGFVSAGDLRLHLSSKLPHYMVPKYYVKLEKIPLTNNGKVNKKSLPNPEDTGLERENYVAPKSEEEKILVQFWSEVLRVRKEEIGLDSDFFALAGDSIKAILLVARLRNVGYELKTSDVLGNSQLQDMATKVRLLTREIDQSAVDGEVPLSPIQRAFFSNAIVKGTDDEKQLYHQSFMLSFSNLVSRLEITIIMDKLLEHHDQLRAKFVRNEEGIWTQWISKENKGYYLIEEEIIPSSHENDKLTIQNFLENKGVFLKNKLSHASGILIGIGLYHDANQSLVLICMHHLIIDVVSWRILFEDINTLLHQLQSRKELRLPKKTDSYKYWIDRNIEYSNSRFIESELNYWKEQEKVKTDKLQLKNFNGRNAYEDIISMSFSFDRKDTAFIQQVISKNRNIEINAFLLSALARSIRDVFDTTKIRINLEGHGREDYMSDIDSSRTIGWFTSLFPFILNTSQKDVDSIYALQDALNRIPGKGVGYGIIRYLSKSPILDHNDTEVTFNYLGQLDLESQASPINNRPENSSKISLFNLSEYRHGKDVHENLEMESNLLITGQIANESLQLNIQFSEKRLDVKRIQLLKEKFQMHLYTIADELSNFHEKRQLPSLFTYNGLSFDVTRELSKQYGEIEDVFPLNGSQLGLLFVSDTEFDSGLYTEQFIDEFKGALNIEKWIHSLSQTIDFNQALRIVFRTDVSSIPVQICLKKFEVSYNFFDISDYFEDELQNKLDDIILTDYSSSFDLRTKPAYRVTFIKLAEDKYIRIWTNHHIIMDGWSSQIFFKQWENFYHGMEIEMSIRENKLKQYFKFLAQIDRTISFNFWNNYLQEYEKTISIPPIAVHFSDTTILSQYEFELERHTTKKLIEFAKNNKFTLSSVVQSLFGILLAKLNNTNDVVFASVVSGRPNVVRNIENLIFNFINLIPVRVKYNLEDTFLSTIRSVSNFFAQVENHQYLPLNETCKVIPGNGGALKVLFVFENYPTSNENVFNSQEKFESKRLQVNDKLEFDITFLCGQEGDSLKFILKSGNVAYSEEQVNSIFRILNRFIDLLINESHSLVGHTELLDTKQRDDMIIISKGKEINEDFADFATLYEKAVKKYASLTAISGLERDYTYKELDELSNKFANYLMFDKGLKKGDVVAVELDRSEWIPISFLGIAKAGMVFLFVDRSYPDKRISFIKNNSNVQFVINKSELLSFQDNIGRISGTNRDFTCLESDLLYIIYTSGTTGIPKGCALTHLNMFNLYLYMIHETELMDSNPKVFQFTTWSFDLSIQEFINALFSGGQLICLSEDDRNDYTKLTNRIVESEASIFYLSPSFLNALMTFEFFVKAKTKLKYLVSAGEQLFISNTLKEYLKYNKLIVYNLYGPAETHVVTGRKFLYSDFDTRLDIGLPTCNNQIWILDSCLNILPIGVQGEVFIAGNSVGFGYINNLSENAERFIHHNQLGRMYKTGDLAFRDFKGCIHYSGRIDDQVKINGVRIELDEIIKCMKSHVDVTNAIALHSTNSNGSKYLASFYTGYLNEFDLRTFLKGNLPANFIPSVIVRLPDMPLNANGKIDKYQLQSILSKERETKPTKKPVTWLQQELVKILCEVMPLSEEAVDIDMNFDEIGLTSLQYIQYVSLLNVRLGYSLSIKDIINSSSIYELFKFLMKPKNKETGLLYSLTGSFDLNKPVLVLFPAFFGEGLYYLELAKYLKADYNVISCNYYSDTDQLFDTDFFAKTIVAEFKSFGFTRILLGGASYGFRVAYRVAYYSPYTITRILNFDGSVYDDFEDEKQKILMINEHEMSTLDKDEILQRQESLTKYFSEDRKLKYQNDYFIGTLKNIEIVNFYPEKSSVKLFSRKDITTGKVIDVSFDGNHDNMLTISNNFKKIKDFIKSHE
jgi:amino acid adenylation domain-containing protein/non-ribosomal peptide synthase protein (TIGR01720 family)